MSWGCRQWSALVGNVCCKHVTATMHTDLVPAVRIHQLTPPSRKKQKSAEEDNPWDHLKIRWCPFVTFKHCWHHLVMYNYTMVTPQTLEHHTSLARVRGRQSPNLNPLDYMWGPMLEEFNKLNPKPQKLLSWTLHCGQSGRIYLLKQYENLPSAFANS